MRVVSLGYFIDNILECLNIACNGEEVEINLTPNKKIRLLLKETRSTSSTSNLNLSNHNIDEDPRCNFSPR